MNCLGEKNAEDWFCIVDVDCCDFIDLLLCEADVASWKKVGQCSKKIPPSKAEN